MRLRKKQKYPELWWVGDVLCFAQWDEIFEHRYFVPVYSEFIMSGQRPEFICELK